MRLSLLLLPALLLAGCAAPDAIREANAPAAPQPWHSEGAFFVKPSQNSDLSTVEIPFLVNATGAEATATIAARERYGPVELPRSSAYVEARLVDADGNTLAEARRMPGGEPTLTLRAKDVPRGEAKLILGIGGGSDEQANGDLIEYTLDAR